MVSLGNGDYDIGVVTNGWAIFAVRQKFLVFGKNGFRPLACTRRDRHSNYFWRFGIGWQAEERAF
jgi:hypothetical protein